MDNTKNKNIVNCYNSKGVLKSVKTFNTLEECFDFVFSKQNKKNKNDVKQNNKNENSFLQLELF